VWANVPGEFQDITYIKGILSSWPTSILIRKVPGIKRWYLHVVQGGVVVGRGLEFSPLKIWKFVVVIDQLT
jgi:hypothetical protein